MGSNSSDQKRWNIFLVSILVILIVSIVLIVLDILCYIPVSNSFKWIYRFNIIKNNQRKDLFTLIYDIISLSVDILLVVIFEMLKTIEDKRRESQQNEQRRIMAMQWARALQFEKLEIHQFNKIDKREYPTELLLNELKKRIQMKEEPLVSLKLISNTIFPIDYTYTLNKISINVKAGDCVYLDGFVSNFNHPISYYEVMKNDEILNAYDSVYDIYLNGSTTVLQIYFPTIDDENKEIIERNGLIDLLSNTMNTPKRLFIMKLEGRASNTFDDELSFDFGLTLQGRRNETDYNIEKIIYNREAKK